MMRLNRWTLAPCAALLAFSGGLSAAQEPPSHPVTADKSAQAAPAGSAATTAPAVDTAQPAAAPGATASGGNPHDTAEVKDTSVDVPDLPAGTLEVLLSDAAGKALSGWPLKLDVLHSSVAEGDSQTSRTVTTDDAGRAVFSGLPATTDYSYRAKVEVDPALFSSAEFQLRPDMGHRQTLHVFPVTRNQHDAQVVGRGVIAIHPRDDVFLIDVLYQLINIGKQAWVPDDLTLKLPEGFKAFTPQDAASATRFDESDPVGAKLLGTYPPGAREVGFRFQVDNLHEESVSFRLPLFPRTIDMRVIVESSPQMSLHVPDFESAFPDRMRTGERVLVAEKNFLDRREASPDMISVAIGGMPTKGNGHKIALAIALGIALFGLYQSRRKPKDSSAVRAQQHLAQEDLALARDLLLDELVELEQARDKKAIGTKAYQKTRQVLLTSLARLST